VGVRMFFKNPELIIDPANPFDGDAFSRQEEIQKLTQIISVTKEPFVLAITSPWGNGKTKFLEMWRAKLIQLGSNSIYYNAWANDFVEDPMISLIGEISSQLNNIKFSEKTKGEKALKKAKDISATILKRSIPAAVKIISAGIIDDKLIAEAISETTTDIIKEKIKTYENSKKDLEKFKKELNVFVSSLAMDQNHQIPFVIFIDELDRCKPDFAIELLERLKHFFNVSGIVFVLAIDRIQLEQSVKTIFGMNNPDGYIRKFIDLEYHLLEPNKGDFSDYLIRRLEMDDVISQKSEGRSQLEDLHEITSELFRLFDLKLRQQEQFFFQLAIIIKLFPNANNYYFSYLCFFLLLSNYSRKLFESFANEEISGEQILEFVEKQEGSKDFFECYSACKLEFFLYQFFTDKDLVEKKIQNYIERSNDLSEKSNRPNVILGLSKRMVGMDARTILKTTVNKIKYSEQFRR
jgi:hypothetical protein